MLQMLVNLAGLQVAQATAEYLPFLWQQRTVGGQFAGEKRPSQI
jgi:hypothetical protein